MEIRALYCYTRDGGGLTVSPERPDRPYTPACRLVAGEGKLVTKDGVEAYPVIDVDDPAGWYEVPDIENSEET